MWRMKPLLKMVARMVGYCTALTALSYFLYYGLLAPSLFPGLYFGTITGHIVGLAVEGVLTGLGLGLAMLMLTAIFFRQIHRPAFYRFAMMTASLILVILYMSANYYLTHLSVALEYRPEIAALFTVVIVKYGLAAYLSHIVAGKYLREIAATDNTAPA